MKSYFLSIIGILIILSLLFVGLFGAAVYLPVDPSSQDKLVFHVEKGEGAKEMSLNLKEQNLIWLKSFFRIYVLLNGVSGDLKAGDYWLSRNMNASQMIKKLVAGDVIKDSITIIEGWNLRDIEQYLKAKGVAKEEEFFELVGFPLMDYSKPTDLSLPNDFSQEFDFLADKPKDISLEGYLFPDTYETLSQDNIESIVRKALLNFDRKLTDELKEEINSQKKSVFEIMTMASLIEKEVRDAEDKKIVSGVLWKRLRNNMPLQVDATIAYITGRKTTEISIAETQINSLYNTYRYRGLPLGPISNPGLESILAAIYPKNSAYWYYLSVPNGQTIFSRTLEEHNIAKARYLR